MEPTYDWTEWQKAARADSDAQRKAHREGGHMTVTPRCPECVRERDRHVAAVLARADDPDTRPPE